MLTEAAMHIGREKNIRQAALLARRHKEYSAKLVKAQEKLADLMGRLDRTPESSRAEFVKLLKERLQAVASRVFFGLVSMLYLNRWTSVLTAL